MAAICPAAKIDSHLRKLICFTIAKLCKKSACDDGDNKIGNQTTNINWKEPPENWPRGIRFINPNNVSKTNKVEPKEKWAMLFAALSCLLRKGIDNILDKFDKFVFDVELLALENSMFCIMDKCNNLRTRRKHRKDLETTWVRDACSYGLGLSISLEPTVEDSSELDRLYSDREKECKNGQKPDFLKTLSTFSSMKELDAESALEVARECLKHDTGESQRNQRKRKRSSSSTIIQSKKKSPDVCALSLLNAQPQSQQTASSQGLVSLVSTPKGHIQQTHLPPPSSAACQNQRLHIAPASPIMSCYDQPTHTSLPQSTAPVQQSTLAQVRQSTPAQVRQSTPAPVHQSTLALVYQSIPAPVHQSTPVPAYQSTPAPVHQSTLAPVHQSTPVPVYQSTPVPVFQSIPVSVHQSTPAPVYQSTPAPVYQSTPVSVQQSTPVPVYQSTPAPVYQSTPVSVHQSTPVPVHQSTPVPVYQSTPVSVHQSTPVPVHQSTPVPVYQSTLVPVNPPTPVSVQQSTAVPDQQTHMISAANKNLQELTVPVINCPIQSIGASLTNVSQMTGTSDPLLSMSGSHRPILPIDRSNLSQSDQARNTFNDDSIWETDSSWTASQKYCDTFDSIFTPPDSI
ncbi:uncharacterized protein [Argopecten irradians]|uniref:uncharacterized protein n=1 Tax=Argopecten irradians TaxID=31199 RepID=UPI0037172CC6